MLYKSTNGGAVWDSVDQYTPLRVAIATNSQGAVFMTSCDTLNNYAEKVLKFHKSTDEGQSWEDVNIPNVEESFPILCVDPKNENNIYAAVKFRIVSDDPLSDGLCKSTDGGATWETIDLSGFLPNAPKINSVYCDPIKDNKIILCSEIGVYISTDGGYQWTESFTGANASCITADPVVEDRYFLGVTSPYQKGGFWMSVNGGSTWSKYNEGLSDYRVQRIVYDSDSQLLFVGTPNLGISRRNVNTLTGIDDELDIPTSFELFQNYPNPFNPTTTINFSVAKSGEYRLTVTNLLGQEIAVLRDGNIQKGRYSASFDAKNLSSGMYFYRLAGEGDFITKKMLLIK